MSLHADADYRHAIYRRLMARNRIVSILRIGVPALGVVALVGLLGQIYLSSLTSRFGIGQISVSRDSVSVEAPEYAGLLDDGTAYRVSATMAQAPIEASDQVALDSAKLVMTRSDGVVTTVDAQSAVLDTSRELVVIKNIANIATSEGTRGVVADSVFDYKTQALTGQGAVAIDYADGTKLVAEGMTYDATRLIWTFTRATVTLQDTPGAETNETSP
jgi:lipopolysaccharide export system protein LptC